MEQEPRTPTPVEDRVNRVHWFAGRVVQVADDVADVTGGGVRVTELTAAEAGEAVLELTEAINRLEGIRAAVLAHAETVDVATESGVGPAATSTVAWLAHAAVLPGGRGRRLVKLATRLSDRFRATGQALQSGVIEVERACQMVCVRGVAAETGVTDLGHAREEHRNDDSHLRFHR